MDTFVWDKAKSYFVVSLAFLLALYTNVKTLQYSNVETFIVFRSSTPILIAVLDYMYLGRQAGKGIAIILCHGSALFRRATFDHSI